MSGIPQKIICLSTEAFYALIDSVLEHVDSKFQLPKQNNWIGTDEAMDILKIKSKTTLQELRANGKIRYSQPQHKVILYDKRSLIEYLEQNAKERF